MVGLVGGPAVAGVVAALQAAPQLALAGALDRLVHGDEQLVAAGGDDRVVQREVPHLELLVRSGRRRRPTQRRISSKSRAVAQATTSGSTCGSISRRAAITSAGPTSSEGSSRAAPARAAGRRPAGRCHARPRARSGPRLRAGQRVADHRPGDAEVGGELALRGSAPGPSARAAQRARISSARSCCRRVGLRGRGHRPLTLTGHRSVTDRDNQSYQCRQAAGDLHVGR